MSHNCDANDASRPESPHFSVIASSFFVVDLLFLHTVKNLEKENRMPNVVQSVKARPITIRKVRLWRKEIDASPSALAAVLQPLDDAGIRLRAFMRYRHFRDEHRAVVEVCPHESEDENHCASVMHAA